MPDSNDHSEKQPLDQFVTNLQREREEEITQKKASKLSLAYKNLVGFQPDPAAVIVIPKGMASRGRIFAFTKDGINIGLAIQDPTRPETIEALKQLDSRDEYEFKPYLVSKSSINYLLGVYDTFAPTQTKQQDISLADSAIQKFSDISNLSELKTALDNSSTSNTVESLFAGAVALEASDIHIEPESDAVRIRFRLDGVLQDITDIPSAKLDSIVDRIKLLAELKLNIHESAQDGRFSIKTQDQNYDLRVSILPTQYGESVVLRLLPQKGSFIGLDELGITPNALSIIESAIAQPDGLILNTGPTGSGKTTTLYAILAKLNQPGRKIITVEDPIEYRLDGITQTQIKTEENYDFANALRAIVRQDPDVILVGEIRDTETAEIAINSSLTGHLVLSTLHTNDAVGSIPRLIDLKAKPEIFADALRLVIAQRLVRKLCTKCKTSSQPSADEVELIQKLSPTSTVPATIYHPAGCDECNGTGYKGRIGIYELLKISDAVRDLITNQSPAHQIFEQAKSEGMQTLGEDGINKVSEGTTSLEELNRVLGTG